ncbi:MAG: hypothetical protein LBF37_02190 [Rickettsiales bacterium]|nr:hypothetical protein [Rickettsiales bacterium]
MKLQSFGIMLSVLALTACGGAGSGGGGAGGEPQVPTFADANSYFIAKTSTLEQLTQAQKSGNAKSLYTKALNEFYTIERAKARTTTNSLFTGGDVVLAAHHHLITTENKDPDDNDVINNWNAALLAYNTELAKHKFGNTTGLKWTGTYKGDAVARNITMGDADVTYNWVDKGNATLNISIAAANLLIGKLNVETKDHGEFNITINEKPEDIDMYYTSANGDDVKSIQGSVTTRPVGVWDGKTYTILNYHVSK